MTRYLMVKANTSSEWDPCEFALIEMNDKAVNLIQDVAKEAVKLNKKYGFCHIHISCDNAEFFSDDEFADKHGIDDGNESIFIDLEDSVVDKLKRPENSIRYGGINIYADSFHYHAYGKHSNESFYTVGLNLEELSKWNQTEPVTK